MAAVDTIFNVYFQPAVLVLINALLPFMYLIVSAVNLGCFMFFGFANKFKVFF